MDRDGEWGKQAKAFWPFRGFFSAVGCAKVLGDGDWDGDNYA